MRFRAVRTYPHRDRGELPLQRVNLRLQSCEFLLDAVVSGPLRIPLLEGHRDTADD